MPDMSSVYPTSHSDNWDRLQKFESQFTEVNGQRNQSYPIPFLATQLLQKQGSIPYVQTFTREHQRVREEKG